MLRLENGQQEWRVLVVDDVLVNRLLLKKILLKAGFIVKEANDGEEAVIIFGEWRPHFIWMDRCMPVMDGLAATRIIRKLEGGDKVVIAIITANVLKEQQSEALEAGADVTLNKPYSMEEIYSCMGKFLGLTYCYAEVEHNPAQPTVASQNMSYDRLAGLLFGTLKEIHQAAMHGESEQLIRLINSIPDEYAELRTSLQYLAANYRYDHLVELIKPHLKEY